MQNNLLKKYCRKIHIPYDEKIENTFGFQAYKFNYQAQKLKVCILKEISEETKDVNK